MAIPVRTLGRPFELIPEPVLRSTLRSPLRRPVLDSAFRILPSLLGAPSARGLSASLQRLGACAHFHLTGRPDGSFDVYRLEAAEGRWRTSRIAPGTERADVTLTLDAADLLLIVTGRTHPLQALLAGRLRVSGNPLLAARLATLLRDLPGPLAQAA